MFSKTNFTLFGLLFVQVIALVLMKTEGGERLGLSASVELLPDLDPAAVTGLTIYGPTADGEAQDKVSLARQGDGWVLPDADGFPVKADEVERLLGTLAGLKSRTPVVEGEVYYDKLEVAHDVYRRKIELSANGETRTLIVGSSPTFKNVHVRVDGEETVYQVSDLSESDAGARAWNWVERSYVDVPKADLWSVALENEHGRIQLDRDPSSDTWAIAGSTLAAKKTEIDALLTEVRTIGLERPIGKTADASFELGKTVRVELTTGTTTIAGALPPSTESLVLEVGKTIGDGDARYLKASSSPYVVEVAGWELKKLIEAKVADLVEAPAEPEAPVEGTDVVPAPGMMPTPTKAAPTEPADQAPASEAAPVEKTEAAPVEKTEAAPVEKTEGAAKVEAGDAEAALAAEAAPAADVEAAPAAEAAKVETAPAAEAPKAEAAPAAEAAKPEEAPAPEAAKIEAAPAAEAAKAEPAPAAEAAKVETAPAAEAPKVEAAPAAEAAKVEAAPAAEAAKVETAPAAEAAKVETTPAAEAAKVETAPAAEAAKADVAPAPAPQAGAAPAAAPEAGHDANDAPEAAKAEAVPAH